MKCNLETIKNAYKKYYSTLPAHGQGIHPLWLAIKGFEKELREKLGDPRIRYLNKGIEVIEEILGEIE